ncbi:MAG TPA: SpoIIE family protein phosphatase [Blastocatellia bacterium]|nr:SpoIIE family protein phosphatase [Blastocatellia bacterium]
MARRLDFYPLTQLLTVDSTSNVEWGEKGGEDKRNQRGIVMATSNSARALIADDQPDVLEALRILLKGEGYQIDSATSPAVVIEKLKADPDCDLLLMDLNYARDTTSGQEGLDLLTHVRQIDDSLPIVVMTAWGSIELAVEAMRRGVGDFVIKPWENDRLLTTLSTQVAAGRRRRKVERMEVERKALLARIDSAKGINGICETIRDGIRTALEEDRHALLARVSTAHAFTAVGVSGGKGTRGALYPRVELDGELSTLGGPVKVADAALPFEDQKSLLDLDIHIIVPARIDGKLLGLIGIGTGTELESEEMSFLSDVASMMASALQNLQSRNQDRDYTEALEIQRGLLPDTLPEVAGLEISAAWRPARVVGGDYYDAIALDKHRLALCIADVSGKGMAAALMMSNLQAIIRAAALSQLSPRQVCNRVNRLISANIASGRFITFFYAVLDSKKKRIEYSNAGHNAPILIRRDGSLERLDRGGAVLGAFPDWDYEDAVIDLCQGDRLIMFTDGVTEATNAADEEFGEKRLLDLITANRELAASTIKTLTLDSVSQFAGRELQDDATLVVTCVG